MRATELMEHPVMDLATATTVVADPSRTTS